MSDDIGPGLDLRRRIAAYQERTIITEATAGRSVGWVARLGPPQPGDEFDFRREFLTEDEADLSRGIDAGLYYHDLPDALYEAKSFWRSGEPMRCFFVISDREVVDYCCSCESSRDGMREAKSWAKTQIAKTMPEGWTWPAVMRRRSERPPARPGESVESWRARCRTAQAQAKAERQQG